MVQNVSSACMPETPRGVTLLEVVIALGILTTAIVALCTGIVTAERLEVLAREEAIALAAAEAAINEIRAAPFSGGTKNVYQFHNERRHVMLAGTAAPNMHLGAASAPIVSGGDGRKVPEEMGIIIINEESPHESYYGDVDNDGDLDFPVDLNLNGSYTDYLSTPTVGQAFPMNLGGDSGRMDETIDRSLLRLVPVAVVVRWTSQLGGERQIQIVTFIGDRLGQY